MELKLILEALLFASQKPLQPREFREALHTAAGQAENEDAPARQYAKIKEEEIQDTLAELEQEYINSNGSFRLVCVAGAWQLVSHADFAPWLRALLGERQKPPRLSQAALETLAIIAYRQPLTRSEMEQIRGVSVDGVMQTLLERGLIEHMGRADVAGRPMTYGTTPSFLEHFGLRSLAELPSADELRKIPVSKPSDSQLDFNKDLEAQKQAAEANQDPSPDAAEHDETSESVADETHQEVKASPGSEDQVAEESPEQEKEL